MKITEAALDKAMETIIPGMAVDRTDMKRALEAAAGDFTKTPGLKAFIRKQIAQAVEAERAKSEKRIAELEEALTPSGATKYAYMGEINLTFGEFTPNVPWTTIKKIMQAIRDRAARSAIKAEGE